MNVQLFNCREYKTQFAATDHNCIITFNKEDNFSNFLQVILQVLAIKNKHYSSQKLPVYINLPQNSLVKTHSVT